MHLPNTDVESAFLCDDEPCKPGYDGRQLLLPSLPHQSTPISDGIIGRLPQLISMRIVGTL